MSNPRKPILVIGGGIAGMTAAVEAAETGYPVVLVEKDASLGGRVLRMHKYFPKMCPPACGFEINLKRLRRNPRIALHTLTTVQKISRSEGRLWATLQSKPRYVTGHPPVDDLIDLGLTSTRSDEFNYGMKETGALFRPHEMAFPPLPVIDKEALNQADTDQLLERAPSGSIDLTMEATTSELEVGAVILAMGWHPYEAQQIENLGFGRAANILTNVMFERLAAPDGPSGGKICRPSDGSVPGSVAFIQCAGSRDDNHLPYCSSVCCMASLKQARYIREVEPETAVTVFYIDIRTLGRLESFYADLVADPSVAFVKGKVARVVEDPSDGSLNLEVEDTLSGEKPRPRFDMVVLATGIVPNTNGIELPAKPSRDESGFIEPETGVEGVFAAGCVARPGDVSSTVKGATSAALKAIQYLGKGN